MICTSPTPSANFITGVLPVDRGDMREKLLPDGRKQYIYDYRGPNGPNHVKGILNNPNPTIAEITRFKTALIEKAENRSLKSQGTRFEDAVDITVKKNKGAGMIWVYNRIKRDLAGPMDLSFIGRYDLYIETLEEEEKSDNTISNHKSAIQTTLNTAFKKRMINDIPVRDFGIKRRFRDRVLDKLERQNLENTMLTQKHFLYWSVRLAEVRPIRSRSDLWHLTRDNLKLVGDGAPYIHFTAKKTDNRERVLKPKVPLIEHPEILEYLKNGIPDDCPLLFPRILGWVDSVSDFESMRNSRWEPMGDPGYHFRALLEDANISDFHFHDFKRMATTYMIDDEGYSADDLLALEFYSTRAMIDKCYKKRDAMKVLRRHNSSISVGPNVVPEVKNVVNFQ